jgi:hypothetical protein
VRFHRGGKTFTNFGEAQGLSTNAIQCTYQDRSKRLWLGGCQGCGAGHHPFSDAMSITNRYLTSFLSMRS